MSDVLSYYIAEQKGTQKVADMSGTTSMVETSTEEGVGVFEDATQDVVAPEGGFCDGKFWDLSLTWNTEDPDFTPCFHQTVRDAH